MHALAGDNPPLSLRPSLLPIIHPAISAPATQNSVNQRSNSVKTTLKQRQTAPRESNPNFKSPICTVEPARIFVTLNRNCLKAAGGPPRGGDGGEVRAAPSCQPLMVTAVQPDENPIPGVTE